MHRRPVGRGRLLAALGALVILAGCVLPWYGLGGGAGELPGISYRAFDGMGILTFLAAIATLALVALPYAAGDRPVGVDRALAYAVLAVLAFVGIALWIPSVLANLSGLAPDRAPGLWIATVGAIVLARAAYEIALEPPRR